MIRRRVRGAPWLAVLSMVMLAGCRLEKIDGHAPGKEPATEASAPETTPAPTSAPEPQSETTPESAAPKLPSPGVYICARADSPPRLDGKLDDVVWQKAAVLDAFLVPESGEPATEGGVARLLWDDKNLYLGVQCQDSDVYAQKTKHDDQTWLDDVVELFVKPQEDQAQYFEFHVTPRNVTLDMHLGSRGSGGYERYRGFESKMRTAATVQGTLNGWHDRDEGWAAEMVVPLSAFYVQPVVGAEWKFNVSRFNYSCYLPDREWSSVSPLTVRDFHHYEDFMTLKFALAVEAEVEPTGDEAENSEPGEEEATEVESASPVEANTGNGEPQ